MMTPVGEAELPAPVTAKRRVRGQLPAAMFGDLVLEPDKVGLSGREPREGDVDEVIGDA
jgi:hypothetical protein